MPRHAPFDAPAWSAELIAARVAQTYLDAFGTLDDLLSRGDLEMRAEDLLAATPRERLPGSLVRISRMAIARLAALEQRLSGRPVLRPADWRVIRYCVTSGRTLRDALERGVDAFDVVDGRCGKMTLRVRGDAAEVELNSLRDTPSARKCLIDLFGVANIHGLLCELIAEPLPIRRISLDYSPNIFAALDLPPLTVPLDLDAGRTSFAFAATYLDHPVIGLAPTPSGQAWGNFLFSEIELADAEAEPMPRRIRRIAMEALRSAGRLPSFDQIVAQVGGSAATIRRRLAQDATNYREIKDSCRRELALELLRRSKLPIEDIAARLDYCDSDAFRRAFRDWLGMAPSEYRHQALARGDS